MRYCHLVAEDWRFTAHLKDERGLIEMCKKYVLRRERYTDDKIYFCCPRSRGPEFCKFRGMFIHSQSAFYVREQHCCTLLDEEEEEDGEDEFEEEEFDGEGEDEEMMEYEEEEWDEEQEDKENG